MSFYDLKNDDPFLGRCLIAKDDIPEAQIVIEERPIVHGLARESDLACFGCYSPLDEDDPDACEKCGLPMCSNVDLCQSNAVHQAECDILQHAGRAISLTLLDDLAILHDVVLVIRLLSLRQDSCSSDWQAVAGMESHLEQRSQVPHIQERVGKIKNILLNDLALQGTAPEEIVHLCGVLDVNSFELPSPHGTVQALFKVTSFMEHNCVPNMHKSFLNGFSIILRAAKFIPKGSHLSLTYTDSFWTTMDRRNFLLETKHFECECTRCADPSELGTHLSTLKCPKCPVGNFMPEDPLDSTSDWSCDACLSVLPSNYAQNLLQQVNETLSLLESADPDPEQCEKFLLIHSRVLHPNHAIMVDVSHTLVHLLGHWPGYLMADLTERQMQMKEDLARNLLRIAEKLLPGISRLRSTTLYQLYLVLQQRAYNWMKSGNRNHRDIVGAFAVAKTSLLQCIAMLEYESEGSPEFSLLATANDDLLSLEEFLAQAQIN
ncbi:SET domain-containing protein SmydA-8-like [Tigriopus californicus]|uniref:SET domain-containing protein SmydA-8-like n=1 Tax=Tigriopus californicus TaxID=6832 RepID=UPI0027DA1D1E|nr:SET domain-containing protein SmydA-8-like [Tigriopus californicus]